MIQTTSGQVDERYQQQCVACGGTGYAKGCEHPDTDFEIVDEQDDYDPEDYL